jgi:hypothetical protein
MVAKEDSRAVSLSAAAAFERLYKFLACAAIVIITEPLIYTIIYPTIGGLALPLAIVGVPVLFALGYAVQALFGAVTGIKRGSATQAYEKLAQYFRFAEAALPLTLCAVAGIAATNAVSGYMRMRYETGIDHLYDKWSVIPFAAGIICAAFIAVGVVSWFYPYSRLISMRSMFACFVLVLADFALNIAFGLTQDFLVACAALFILFSAVVMNQSHIVGVINATGTGVVTPRVRFYNLLAVGIVCILVAAAMPIILTVLVGLAVLGKMILFFILRGIFGVSEETQYEQAEVQGSEFGASMFGGIGDLGGASVAKNYFTIFMILLLAVLLFLILIRRKNLFKVIYNFINNLFANIMDFLANIFEFNRFSTEKFALSDYRDVETKTDKKAIREFTAAIRPARSYREFERRLESILEARARLMFAYNELVRCWSEKNIGLNISDTPAEIEQKVLAAVSGTDAEVITRAFETVKYAERDLPGSESTRLVAAMCAQIKRAYGD